MCRITYFSAFLFCLVVNEVSCQGTIGGTYDLGKFPDKDAYYLAKQDHHSFLDPPIEIYKMIHSELEAIRAEYPHTKQIHVTNDNPVPGKVFCSVKIGFDSLNASLYGPIAVDELVHIERDNRPTTIYMVTFTRPYESTKMTEILKNYGAGSSDCQTVKSIGTTNQIIREIDDKITFTFTLSSQGCFSYPHCYTRHNWKFEVNGNNVTLITTP